VPDSDGQAQRPGFFVQVDPAAICLTAFPVRDRLLRAGDPAVQTGQVRSVFPTAVNTCRRTPGESDRTGARGSSAQSPAGPDRLRSEQKNTKCTYSEHFFIKDLWFTKAAGEKKIPLILYDMTGDTFEEGIHQTDRSTL
jgi:hypothetical protein